MSTDPTSRLEIVEAHLDRAEHRRAIEELTNAYAMDPMGGGTPLPDEVRRSLVPGLRAHPTTMVFLAYRGDEAVGMATCFRGFSTFTARPLINIHDLIVRPSGRGQGVGPRLLQAVEDRARALGCCKVTLEVLESNDRAIGVYERCGFARQRFGDPPRDLLLFSKSL